MTWRSMVFVGVLITAGACALGAMWWLSSSSGMDARTREMLRQAILNSRSELPEGRLASDWLECLGDPAISAAEAPLRARCVTWTTDGVSSTLVALRADDVLVPVVETSIAGLARDERVIVDLVGGPGGTPFHANPAADAAFFRRIKEAGLKPSIWGDMRKSPYRELMDHGYIIASVGYWGTNVRTLEAADEIELAFDDVRVAVDFYRDRIGSDPALITTSLGNHLALGALGRGRLERMEVLSLVPVMDGLQHHLRRYRRDTAAERAEAEANGELYGSWHQHNIYRRSGDAIAFDHSRMVNGDDFNPRYVGTYDLAWRDITPKGECSRILLGAIDPRTRDYLQANKDLPPYIIVLGADHDLAAMAPEDVRGLFFDFADCLVKQAA